MKVLITLPHGTLHPTFTVILHFLKTIHFEFAVKVGSNSYVGPEANGEVMPKHMRQSYRIGMQKRIKNG